MTTRPGQPYSPNTNAPVQSLGCGTHGEADRGIAQVAAAIVIIDLGLCQESRRFYGFYSFNMVSVCEHDVFPEGSADLCHGERKYSTQHGRTTVGCGTRIEDLRHLGPSTLGGSERGSR